MKLNLYSDNSYAQHLRIDKKVIDQKRQDNVELCKMFNEEHSRLKNIDGPPAYDHLTSSFMYENKFRYRREIDIQEDFPGDANGGKARPKRHMQERDDREEVDSNRRRGKREVAIKSPEYDFNMKADTATTSRLNLADQARVENLVEKLYDDMSEIKGRPVKYRKKMLETTTKHAPPQGGRKKMFYFAPHLLEGKKEVIDEGRAPPSGPRVDWPKYWHHGVIPYFIDPKTYDGHLAARITNAFDYFEKATCIRLQRLREKPTDARSMKSIEWIYITNPSGIRQCVHSNERKPNVGVQVVVFGYDCMSLGEITHEVMHTLGFSHEHTRPDRDRYITILWDNIKPGYRKYFEPRKDDPLYTLPYDYASVLHYPPRAFSRNGQLTILSDGGLKIGQREGISETDVEKVSMIFGNDCMMRNKEYLLTTCPSVIKNKDTPTEHPTKKDIQNHFKDKLWPYGVINFKFKDMTEFSTDERENINAVMQHIGMETCIRFKDMSEEDEAEQNQEYDDGDLGPVYAEDSKNNDPLSTTSTTSPTSATDINDNEQDSKDDNININNNNERRESERHFNNDIGDNKLDMNFVDTLFEKSTIANDDTVEYRKRNSAANGNSTAKSSNAAKGSSTAKGISTTKGSSTAKGSSTTKGGGTTKGSSTTTKGSTPQPLKSKPASTVQKATTLTHPPKASKQVPNENSNNITRALKKPISEFKRKKYMKAGNNDKQSNNKKATAQKPVRSKRAILKTLRSSSRRSVENSLILSRTARPGCQCPSAGKQPGETILEISSDCFNSVNDLLHAFVHVLGLEHQHNMYDRDSYLHIVWNNLTEEIKDDLQNIQPSAASAGFPYDYQSVMHFPWLQIKNGVTNLMYPIWNDGWAMGHWQGLSSTDVQKLNLIYFDECLKRKKEES